MFVAAYNLLVHCTAAEVVDAVGSLHIADSAVDMDMLVDIPVLAEVDEDMDTVAVDTQVAAVAYIAVGMVEAHIDAVSLAEIHLHSALSDAFAVVVFVAFVDC